jgi:hypothetical protein
MKQRHAELGFERVNLPRCRRLTEVELRAGTAKPARLGRRHEHSQGAQVHQ